MLPRVHGSALFTRGETQALATLTLGTKEDMQRLDLLFEQDQFKRFMLHYNFPPFSVGEVKFLRGPGRREIGHGALAERALVNLLPPEAEFPYAMRLVSDILESNGSSSMATVCGGSLALMDAGVPIKSPCAGIAMGLVVGDDNKYSILTDIAGAEDHYGDMDFKVAGTRAGITALQMDIKVLDISIRDDARSSGPGEEGAAGNPRHHGQDAQHAQQQISAYAPRLYKLKIPQDKIRDLIGPGGKKIKSIIEATGVKIDVLEDGTVHIFSTSGAGGDQALQMVRDVTASAEIGKTYLGKVVRLGGVRRVRRAFPGHRRLAAHQRNLRASHPRRSRRTEARRPGAGQGAFDRGQQGSPVAQGADQGSARKAGEEGSGRRWRDHDPNNNDSRSYQGRRPGGFAGPFRLSMSLFGLQCSPGARFLQ